MTFSRSAAVVIVTAAVFGLTYGLSAPLIAMQLDERGVPGLLIGANAAMHAVGVLLIAPLLPRIVTRWGFSPSAQVALVIAAVVLCAFPLLPVIVIWFGLRVLLGMAAESLFVISESWLSAAATDASRGQMMGVYVAAMSGGIALGPAILAYVGHRGGLPFLIGAALVLVAILILRLSQPTEITAVAPAHSGMLTYLRLAPVAAIAAALNAAVEAMGLSLLPLYAVDLGWSEAQGSLLLSVLLIGAILLQLPIGWLGNRVPVRHLIPGLALAAAVGAAIWPVALLHPWLAWPLLFVWGGVFVGIYTLVLTEMGARFQGGDLAGIFAVMSVAWGIGALVGPLLGGAAMHLGRHGLPLATAVLCLVFALSCRLLPDALQRPANGRARGA